MSIVKFNLPNTTSGNATGKVTETLGAIDNAFTSTVHSSKIVKSLDLSYYYGRIGTAPLDTDSWNPYKKFHQMTLYLNPYDEYISGDWLKTPERKRTTSRIITSNLPDNFTYSLGSDWCSPLDFNKDISGLVDTVYRSFIDNRGTLRTIASTGRMWVNTKPFTLSLTIHAFDDTGSNTFTNIQECLSWLGEYTLPKEADTSGVYVDPPQSVQLHIATNTKQNSGQDKDNERINAWNNNSGKYVSLLLGGMLYISQMAITDVQVTYPNTKMMLLHNWEGGNGGNERLLPSTADITIKLTTLRGLTTTDYTKMLLLSANKNGGNLDQGGADFSAIKY